PDLQVTALTANSAVQPGQSLNISWTVSNAGAGLAKGPWVDQVYLSSTGTLTGATLLTSITRSADVASGGFYNVSIPVNIPTASDGTYRVIVLADGGNAVFEGANENNNQRASDPVTITHPDLAASITSSPSNASSGDTV